MKTDTAEQLLEALTVEESGLTQYKTQLGIADSVIDECSHDRANLAVSLDNIDIVEADKKGVTKVKNLVYEGSTSETVQAYPAFTLTPLPFPNVKAGAKHRYSKRKAHIMSSGSYTTQIGLACGYEDAQTDPISFDTLVAALKPADLGGYQYKVDFQKKGTSGMLIQERPKGTEKWLKERTALESGAVYGVDEPAQEGAAVQIEIRGRHIKGNQQVGEWSPTYSLTVNA